MLKKRFTSLFLALAMVLGLSGQAFAAEVQKADENAVSIVKPVTYQDVAEEILMSHETTEIHQETGDYYYFWGDNSFVVKDSTGYYFVQYSEDFTQFSVNGKTFNRAFNAVLNENEATPFEATYPSKWYIGYDETYVFDVGGLPHSVVAGLISGKLASYVSGPIVSALVGAVVGAVGGMFLSGVFPVDYKITVMTLKQFRILSVGPTEIEFYEREVVYGGPAAQPQSTTLYFDSRSYIEYE